MTGVVLFGGTTEGREIAEWFAKRALPLAVSVATEYGAGLLPEGVRVHTGRLDEGQMEEYLCSEDAKLCLDATHPYAALVTENIRAACRSLRIPYIRVLRDSEPGQPDPRGQLVFDSVAEAARYLAGTQGKILVTTGSKELDAYRVIEGYTERCYVRVLPSEEAMRRCGELGYERSHVIGMQGPFSKALNEALLRQTGARWLVTKASGREGGWQEKADAARAAGATLVVVKRPEMAGLGGSHVEEAHDSGMGHGDEAQGSGVEPDRESRDLSDEHVRASRDLSDKPAKRECVTGGEHFLSLEETFAALSEMFQEENHKPKKVYLVGMGPGDPGLLTADALAALKEAELIIGAKRILDICPEREEKECRACYRREEIVDILKAREDIHTAALVYSGDIGYYSGARGMGERLAGEGYVVVPVPGIASPVYFLDRLGVPWDDVKLVSCHGSGREADGALLASIVNREDKVCALLGAGRTVPEAAGALRGLGLGDVRITVGERLSYPGERLFTKTAGEDWEETDSLAIALFENPTPHHPAVVPGLADERFKRGRVPMTKEEIRTLSLSKLRLTRDAVLYDIGAGTGSVTVEAALLCPEGTVYAVEQRPEGCALIRENCGTFGLTNVNIIEGHAPEALAALPAPTHVFIGGSDGGLGEILDLVLSRSPQARVVINVTTLETLAEVTERIRLADEGSRLSRAQMIQVRVDRGRRLGRYHAFEGGNPVTILSF